MRKIQVEKWKATGQDGKEVEDGTIGMVKVLLVLRKPEDMPRGIDQFRLYGRLDKAMISADNSGTLILEEMDYKFLKDTIEKEAPATWGLNERIRKVVEDFMNAKEE